MSEIKLLPCPFCGGEAKVSNLNFNQYLIFCKDCWAETKPTTGLENTITKWNTRKPIRPSSKEWSGNGNFKEVLAWIPLPEPYIPEDKCYGCFGAANNDCRFCGDDGK